MENIRDPKERTKRKNRYREAERKEGELTENISNEYQRAPYGRVETDEEKARREALYRNSQERTFEMWRESRESLGTLVPRDWDIMFQTGSDQVYRKRVFDETMEWLLARDRTKRRMGILSLYDFIAAWSSREKRRWSNFMMPEEDKHLTLMETLCKIYYKLLKEMERKASRKNVIEEEMVMVLSLIGFFALISKKVAQFAVGILPHLKQQLRTRDMGIHSSSSSPTDPSDVESDSETPPDEKRKDNNQARKTMQIFLLQVLSFAERRLSPDERPFDHEEYTWLCAFLRTHTSPDVLHRTPSVVSVAVLRAFGFLLTLEFPFLSDSTVSSLPLVPASSSERASIFFADHVASFLDLLVFLDGVKSGDIPPNSHLRGNAKIAIELACVENMIMLFEMDAVENEGEAAEKWFSGHESHILEEIIRRVERGKGKKVRSAEGITSEMQNLQKLMYRELERVVFDEREQDAEGGESMEQGREYKLSDTVSGELETRHHGSRRSFREPYRTSRAAARQRVTHWKAKRQISALHDDVLPLGGGYLVCSIEYDMMREWVLEMVRGSDVIVPVGPEKYTSKRYTRGFGNSSSKSLKKSHRVMKSKREEDYEINQREWDLDWSGRNKGWGTRWRPTRHVGSGNKLLIPARNPVEENTNYEREVEREHLSLKVHKHGPKKEPKHSH